MRALILSAGLGERLRPLTLRRAKPAIEFLNVPTLGFPYYWLNTLNLKELVLNTHYLPDSIRRAAMHVVDPAQPLFFTHEETILGSGGGIWNARMYLESDEDFAVANGDGVILSEDPYIMEQMLEFHKKRDALATLLVCPLEGVGTRLPGVWVDNAGEVSAFGKSSPHSYTECLHFASYAIYSKRLWKYLPDGSSNILYDVLTSAMLGGEKVYGFRVDKMRWFETGNIPEYLSATQQCLELMRDNGPLGQCARRIVQKLGPPFEEHSRLEELRLIADSAVVDAKARVHGYAVIGADCRMSEGTTLENGVLLPGASLSNHELCRSDVRI